VSFHNHGDDEVNPIASTAAFAQFQQDHAVEQGISHGEQIGTHAVDHYLQPPH
jgi:hypothetical protein